MEFDFVPLVDSISFRYVFASEEYKEFVGSQFGDAHAILISGPGINGNQNLMRLPNGDEVSIHNVHGPVSNAFGIFPPTNSDYYVDNIPISNSTDPTELGFDGYTQSTVAKVTNLEVGAIYHMIIGVADGNDPLFDSALFIEACDSCDYTLGAEVIEVDNFSVYPNPLKGEELNIESEGFHAYQILDLTGKEIHSGEFTETAQIQLAQLLAGAYLVILDNGMTARFIKQ